MDIRDKIAKHLTDDPSIISESLEDDVQQTVDRINAGALDINTARKLFQQEVANYQWSDNEITQIIDFINMYYPLDQNIFQGGWRPRTAWATPAAPPLKLFPLVANNTTFDSELSIWETGGYASGYPATHTTPAEPPEWEQNPDDEFGGYIVQDGVFAIIDDKKGEFKKAGLTLNDVYDQFNWNDYYIIIKYGGSLETPSPPPMRRGRRARLQYEEDPDEYDRLEIGGGIEEQPPSKVHGSLPAGYTNLYIINEPNDISIDEETGIVIYTQAAGIVDISEKRITALLQGQPAMWIPKADLLRTIPSDEWDWTSE